VATWDEFTAAAPELAAAGRALWDASGLMFLATVRANGAPRLHPVAPVSAAGELLVAISHRSPKWRDLHHEPRCVLHALPGRRDDEFAVRCRAVARPDLREPLRAAAGHVIHDDDHVFAMAIDQVDLGWWELVGEPGTYPVRRRWRAG
jgi:hypothetical protein